jgi:RecA-family ATPase
VAQPKLRNLKYLMETPVPPAQGWIRTPSGVVLPKSGKGMIVSAAKSGKSWLTLQAAKDIAYGANLFGHPLLTTEPARILLIEAEVGENPLHERIQKVYNDSDWENIGDYLWTVSRDPEIKIDTGTGVRKLEQYISESQPNIIILDPVSRLMEGDDSSNPEVKKVFEHIDYLIEKYHHLGLSVLLTHHQGKSLEEPKDKSVYLNPYRSRGASMWVDAPDMIMSFYRGDNLYPGWSARARFTLRHGEDMPDFSMKINHYRCGAKWVSDDSPSPVESKPRGNLYQQLDLM